MSADSSFAQAQQRLVTRRRARESAQAAQLAARRSESRLRARMTNTQSPLVSRLASSTVSVWDAISDAVSGREGTRPAFRVGQVDAELLDEELVELLRGQAGDGLRYFGGTLKEDWAAEMTLVLRAVLFKLTVWDHDATYGAALQNLKYTDARRAGPALFPPTTWQKSLYGLVTVGGRYAWTRWESWLLEDDSEAPSSRLRQLSRMTSWATTLYSASTLFSFLVFLLQGRYRTVLDRILRMRLAAPTSQIGREVSFEYLNRQLVWHALTEFLLFILPLVGINRWRRWLTRTWRKTREMMNAGIDRDTEERKGELAFLPERTCAICHQDQNSAGSEAERMTAATISSGVVSAKTDISNPYEAIPCGCVYCFVCLATRMEWEEGEGWTCLRCGDLVKEGKPWNGDVLGPPKKSPGVKTVGFADRVRKTERDESESGQEMQ